MKRFLSNISICVFFLAAVLITACVAGCSPDYSAVTSKDAGLYVLGSKVVGYDGKELLSDGEAIYEVSKDGDIVCLSDNEIVVHASNTQEFTCISDITISDKKLEIEMPTIELDEDEFYYEPVTWTIEMKASPYDTVSKEISVKSTDTFALYIEQKCDCINVEADSNNKISFDVTACYPGEHELKVYDIFGNKIDTLIIKVTEKLIEDEDKVSEIEEEIESCEHEFSDKTVKATRESEGYTVHKCLNCGYVSKTD